VLDRLGVGWDFFHAINPALSLVSISNFGQDGPYRDFKATDLVLYALSGEMYSMGMTEREPVKMAGTAALIESGASISAALMGTLWAARRHGIGQHVDISLSETHFGGVDRRHATAIAYQYSGRKTLRVGSQGGGMPGGIYPCADGYVDFTNASLRYDRVVDMLGDAPWTAEPQYLDPVQRLDPAVIEEWNAQFLVWCLERTKREVWAEARRAKVLCGPLFSMQDLFEDQHFRDRGFWHEVHHPDLGKVTIPAAHSKCRRAVGRPPPGATARAAHRRGPSGSGPDRRGDPGRDGDGGEGMTPKPLDGVRIVDLCVVWAGPFATMILGDLGAEIIKPENPFVFQPMTRGAIARPPQILLELRRPAWAGLPAMSWRAPMELQPHLRQSVPKQEELHR
jgi:crotonobetainyl-CoA:carnitine CoA-transferase CaiB-like acyl-CoA transferase